MYKYNMNLLEKMNIEHKKNFFGKIIELINFIIDKEGGLELDINIQDILKGKKS